MSICRVLVVEDDDACREQLAQAVSSVMELRLLGAVATLGDARLQIAACVPDVMLVDLGLPDGQGTDLIREVYRAHPATLSMVISAFGDEAHVVDAISAGACGYILKDASAREISRAILDLRAGGSPLSAPVARFVLDFLRAQAPRRPEDAADTAMLSERENEVLRLIAKGDTYAEIGHALGISVNTVREHIRRIYRKLSVCSRGAAVFEAHSRRLL